MVPQATPGPPQTGLAGTTIQRRSGAILLIEVSLEELHNSAEFVYPAPLPIPYLKPYYVSRLARQNPITSQ